MSHFNMQVTIFSYSGIILSFLLGDSVCQRSYPQGYGWMTVCQFGTWFRSIGLNKVSILFIVLFLLDYFYPNSANTFDSTYIYILLFTHQLHINGFVAYFSTNPNCRWNIYLLWIIATTALTLRMITNYFNMNEAEWIDMLMKRVR